MRIFPILFLVIILSVTCNAKATNQVTAANSGNWSSVSTWSCNCVPSGSINVEIPEGITVTVSKSVLLKFPAKVTLMVRGTLNLDECSLYFDNDDQIVVDGDGKIKSCGITGAALYFGKLPIFISSSVPMRGPNKITAGKLPEKLIGFKAARDDKEVCIQWSSIHNFDYDFYKLGRSEDGIVFVEINEQSRSNISSDNFSNCIFHDVHPLEGIAYYRLTAGQKNQEDANVTIVLVPTRSRKTTF